jgi:heme/copper-type cytochrome/quinol oxidase subunit 3
VERLTKVTLLLTKVTFILLPISIMTSYFSTQLKDVEFKLRDYWVTFGIILGLALVGMLLFGFYSGTNEAAIIYRPLSRKFVDLCRRIVRERKSRNA